jgi:hypothetical protein
VDIGLDPLALRKCGPEGAEVRTLINVIVVAEQGLDGIGRFLCVVMGYTTKNNYSVSIVDYAFLYCIGSRVSTHGKR